ncbi:MAG TPA: hypothetical protein VNS09_20645 [Solirubrobacter sp.]|nr:hypothetical protein [Solirubrobacter sp.]
MNARLAWLAFTGIMDPDTRIALRRAWGLCATHAWGLAMVECELRDGALPATSALYADLAAGAAQALGARDEPAHGERGAHAAPPSGHVLRGDGRCFACRPCTPVAAALGPGPRFLERLHASWPHAAPRACPACARGSGPPCRPHLLAGLPAPDDLASRVRRIGLRVGANTDEAAWLEALGWFTGWELPASLAGAARHEEVACPS